MKTLNPIEITFSKQNFPNIDDCHWEVRQLRRSISPNLTEFIRSIILIPTLPIYDLAALIEITNRTSQQ